MKRQQRQPRDPLANLQEQLAIAKRIVSPRNYDPEDAHRLAVLVVGLNDWLTAGVTDFVNRLDRLEGGLLSFIQTVHELEKEQAARAPGARARKQEKP